MSGVIEPLTDDQLEQWAQALESRKYKQGTEHLCHDGRYCCLGVLAELRGDLVDGSFVKVRGGHSDPSILEIAGQTYFLPRPVQDILVAKNDSGDTFPEIAAYIRENLIGGAS